MGGGLSRLTHATSAPLTLTGVAGRCCVRVTACARPGLAGRCGCPTRMGQAPALASAAVAPAGRLASRTPFYWCVSTQIQPPKSVARKTSAAENIQYSHFRHFLLVSKCVLAFPAM